MNKAVDILVVGAGAAGLTAAAYCAKAGLSTLVCERAEKVGGLVGTFTHEGFAFDAGIRALEDSGMDYKAAYVFISTLQMINILGKNSRTIMNAQRARGVETQGNMLVRAKAFFPSLVPLILGAITNSEERVLTLESKGFDVKCQKTHLFELERTGKEPVVNVISIIITLAVVGWRVALWVL